MDLEETSSVDVCQISLKSGPIAQKLKSQYEQVDMEFQASRMSRYGHQNKKRVLKLPGNIRLTGKNYGTL